MANGEPRIYVLLPVHNRKRITENFIDCLLAQTYRNWHLVLIDDGSTDGTDEMAKAKVSSLTVLRGKGNWWWGGALQQGYKWLRREHVAPDAIVLINNDDTEFAPDFLDQAVKALKPRSLLLARPYSIESGAFAEAGLHWDWSDLSWRTLPDGAGINCFSTRGLFLRVGDFMKIGGFHPILLPHYLSDYEFTQRAHRKGFSLISDPAVRLTYHENLTGIRQIEAKNVRQRMMMLLSIRSTDNPIYWSSFILLACPVRYIPANLARIWRRYLLPLARRIRGYWQAPTKQ